MPPVTGSICYYGFITTILLWLLVLRMLPYTASTHERHTTVWSRKRSPSLDQKNTRRRRRNMNSWCFGCRSPTTAVAASSVLRGGGSKGNISSDDDDDDDDELTNQRGGNRWRASARQQRTSLPQQLSSQHGRRKACSLYIWNAPSALLHRWCHHLQRDNIYEGLGGKKFVRIQPGSMLQLLYPCSRYSVDKCVLCGGTFRDHLTLWWSKNLYTPFDRYLDQIYRDSVTKPVIESVHINGKRNYLIKSESPAFDHDQKTEELGYHRQYVLDITTLFDNIQKPREKANQLLRTIRQHYRSYSNVPQMSINTMEQRRWPPYSKQSKIRYIVPRDSAMVDSISSLVIRSNKSLFLSLARDICLDAIDQLIDLQQRVEM